jgi:hypothetical protein
VNYKQVILAFMDNASISPFEFLALIEDPAPASRQKSEDRKKYIDIIFLRPMRQ